MDEAEADRFALHAAAREGDASRAGLLLKNNPKLSNRADDDGRLPIHWAASSNNLDIVTFLASQYTFNPDVQDGAGWTPLMISVSVPDSEPVVRLILQKDADLNLKTNNGQSVLHFVASKKNLDMARLLLNNTPPASTRVRDRRGQYPIHRAAAVGSVPMVSLLLKHKSPLNAADNETYTPLHHAVAEGHVDVAVLLLKEGADFTLKTSEELTALDLAPDKEVRRYIAQGAEREGVDLTAV